MTKAVLYIIRLYPIESIQEPDSQYIQCLRTFRSPNQRIPTTPTPAPNAIAENFNTTRQAVSKHLRILTECQLVKQEQQGREIYYSLEIEKMKEFDNWLSQYRKLWETRFNQLDKVLSTIKKQKK